MFSRIKNTIDRELKKLIQDIDKLYSLSRISPILYSCIKDFVLREGKRIRPILFVIGYLGFSKKKAPGLYRTAISIELLHDFMLVHDDVIDKSDTRRGKPSMHKMLNNFLGNNRNIKFSGQDLAIVVGDVMYAMAIQAFLSIQENPLNKERALKKFIKAAAFTGAGEFIELLSGLKGIDKISKADIYKIYDYKTAYYTFSTPLASGAILAGANETRVNKLFKFGILLGRAFQIKDDILGLFGDEKKIGKSIFTDLQEAKKTLLLWRAYKKSKPKDKLAIKRTLKKRKITKKDLALIQQIVKETGSLDYAKKEVSQLRIKSKKLIKSLPLKKEYKDFLSIYPEEILGL
jgi:geranylgeranyl diphosphate synthase type I